MTSSDINIEDINSNLDYTSNNLYVRLVSESDDLNSNINNSSNNLYNFMSSRSITLNSDIDTFSNSLYNFVSSEVDDLNSNLNDTSNALYSIITSESSVLNSSINTSSNNIYSNIELEFYDLNSNFDVSSNDKYDIIVSKSLELTTNIDTTSNNLYSIILSESINLNSNIDYTSNSLYGILSSTSDSVNGLIEPKVDTAQNILNVLLISSNGFNDEIPIRYYHDMISIDSNIYIYGGYNGVIRLNDLYKINTDLYPDHPDYSKPITLNGVNKILPRSSHTMTSIDNDIYIFGGYNGSSKFNDLYKIDTTTFDVTEITTNGFGGEISGRYEHSMTSIDNDIYIFGGYDGSYLNDLYKIDTRLSSDDPKYSTPITLSGFDGKILTGFGHSMTSVGSNIYIFGGRNSESNHNSLYKINTITYQVTEITSNGFGGEISARYEHGMISIDKDIYIFGGYSGLSRLNDLYKIDTTLSYGNDNYIIPITTNGFFNKIINRGNYGITSIGNDIYIFGGRGYFGLDVFTLNDFYKISKTLVYDNVHLNIEETLILSENILSYIVDNSKLRDHSKNITKLNVILYNEITMLTINLNDLQESITEIEIVVKNNDSRSTFDIELNGFREILTITIINEKHGGGGFFLRNEANNTVILHEINKNVNDIETITIDTQRDNYTFNSNINDDSEKIQGLPREVNLIINEIIYSDLPSGTGLTIDFDQIPSVDVLNVFVNSNIYGGYGARGLYGYYTNNYLHYGGNGGNAITITGVNNSMICYIYIKNKNMLKGGGGGGGSGINPSNAGGNGAYYDETQEKTPNWNTDTDNGGNGGGFNQPGESFAGQEEVSIDGSPENIKVINETYLGGSPGERVSNTSGATVIIIDEDDTNTDVINFTGQHRTIVKLTNPLSRYGYIVSATDEYYKKKNKKSIDIIESLPIVELSKTIKDKKVFGVISDKVEVNVKIENHYETSINSIGEGAIWVCDINGNLENGDYITSSVIPGVGMKQDDDLLHNYTVGKITMDCDFNPEYVEVKRIKTEKESLMFKDNKDNKDNLESSELIEELVYDDDNNIMYEYRYMLKYIRLNGDIIDKLTYEIELSSNLEVYKMAFVGCTYHCG